MDFLKTYLDLMIFGTLGFMSFLMIWFAVERLIFFRTLDLDSVDHAEELKVLLTRNLTTISSVGSNAPYIGLLGTVLGILITFYDLGQGAGIDPSVIMLGLSMALKATAAGLFVAIPAILIYNALLRRVEVLIARWQKAQDSQS